MTDHSLDCIFALSVAPGRAALHLHRITGAGCRAHLLAALRSPAGAPLPRLDAGARYLHVVDAEGGLIDDAIVTVFVAPRSFTGEDSIEISTHGNPLISARLQRRLRQLGLREARPGEFTQRAFLNGKLDLAQAEAVNLLIHAETEGGIGLARAVTEGTLSRETQALRQGLVAALAHIEAHIDFSDDEVGALVPAAFVPELEDLATRLAAMAATYETGRRVREGVRIALCGSPNAGKSTLFNALLRSDRAIVTDIPGTTRDVLEERLVLSGRDFVLSDTAGVRETRDTVEKLGVERSLRAAGDADLICYVADGTRADADLAGEFHSLVAPLPGARVTVALTKADTWTVAARTRAESLRGVLGLPAGTVTWTSAGDTSPLEKAFVDLYDALTARPGAGTEAVLISARQRNAVAAAEAHVRQAIDLLLQGAYPEKAASVLLAANRSLIEVVGEISVDDVLGSIFSSFCIGK